MELSTLTAVSPVDGRYRTKTSLLSAYFSEYALIRDRVKVEVEYFIALCQLPLNQLKAIEKKDFERLRQMVATFNIADAQRIKEIEKTTNHDVKAIEYYLKEQFDNLGLTDFKEFIHFGLTSQDINNTATPLGLKNAMEEVYSPVLSKLLDKLKAMAQQWRDIPMLARTHGQPASPTTLGKEILVFHERIKIQASQLTSIPVPAKFGGATGNFNAHLAAFPQVDWIEFGRHFVNETLGLHHSWPTTQIEHYDNLAAIFDALCRINTILIDLCRDIWTYISMDYFKQIIKDGEVGSSAMPHKVNPIDFENAEGNLGLANALFGHLSAKLPISRLQRDLTDSTVLRNIGVPMAHTQIALDAILRGLDKLMLNEAQLQTDLEKNWMVIAEAIQTILRREGYPKPYETLLELTRHNRPVNKETIHSFIQSLAVEERVKAELMSITPHNYFGLKA